MTRALLLAASLILATRIHAQEETPPHDDRVYVATSEDGLRFDAPPAPALEKASAPSLVLLRSPCGSHSAGTFLLYAMDFSSGSRRSRSERIAVSTSTDGKDWTDRRSLVFDEEIPGAGDPAAVQLEDGSIRLYFQVPNRRRSTDVRSARSEDGVTFRLEEGIRLEDAGNPDVLLAGGEWFLFVSAGKTTELARSKDGLVWTMDPSFGVLQGGCAAACLLEDGRLRVYAHDRGMESWIYDPTGGGRPAHEEGTRIQLRGIVADPSLVRTATGDVFLAFKFQEPRR